MTGIFPKSLSWLTLCLLGVMLCGCAESQPPQLQSEESSQAQQPQIETPSSHVRASKVAGSNATLPDSRGPVTLTAATSTSAQPSTPGTQQQSSALSVEAAKFRDLGTQAFDQEDYATAIQHYSRALELQEHPDLLLARAMASMGQEDYQTAITDCSRALQLMPLLTEAWMMRGMCYRELGDTNRALMDLTMTIELDPTSYSAYVLRGTIWINLEQYELAIPDWEALLQCNEEFAYSANLCLGTAYLKLGKKEKAEQHWEEAFRLEPDNFQAYFALGHTLIQMHKNKLGKGFLEKALSLKPDSLEVLNDLVMLYCTCQEEQIRNQARAWELAQRACELTGWKDYSHLAALATVHAQGGNFQEARRWQQESLRFASEKERPELVLRLKMYEQNETPYITTSPAHSGSSQR